VNTVFNLNFLQSRNVIASDKTEALKEENFQDVRVQKHLNL